MNEMPRSPGGGRRLEIIWKAVASLKPYARNARMHSKKQVHQIARSIGEFGFTVPVLVDGQEGIIAGHGRVEAAKELGMETVPCIRIDHLTEEQKRAYILADNRIAENASWDPEILRVELEELSALDLTFDLDMTGFELGRD